MSRSLSAIYKALARHGSATQELIRRTLNLREEVPHRKVGADDFGTAASKIARDVSKDPHKETHSDQARVSPSRLGEKSLSGVKQEAESSQPGRDSDTDPKAFGAWLADRQRALENLQDCQNLQVKYYRQVIQNEHQEIRRALETYRVEKLQEPAHTGPTHDCPYVSHTNTSIVAAVLTVKDDLQKWTQKVMSSKHSDARKIVTKAKMVLHTLGAPGPLEKEFALQNYIMQHFVSEFFSARSLGLRRRYTFGRSEKGQLGDNLLDQHVQLEDLPSTLKSYRRVARLENHADFTLFVCNVFHSIMKTGLGMEGDYAESNFLGNRNSTRAIQRGGRPDECFYNLFYTLSKSVAKLLTLLQMIPESRATELLAPGPHGSALMEAVQLKDKIVSSQSNGVD